MWEKGYQEVDSVVSSITTKAKGVTVTNTSKLGFRIWDVADYVIPAQVCCPLRLCLALKPLQLAPCCLRTSHTWLMIGMARVLTSPMPRPVVSAQEIGAH